MNKTQDKQKRWFVGVSGWGLELEAGSHNTMTRQVKRSIPMPDQTKTYVNAGVNAAAVFTHNTLYTASVLSGITQGLFDYSRIGDFIRIKTVSFKMLVDTSAATTPTNTFCFRAMLLASSAQYYPAGFAAGLGTTDVFFSGPDSPVNKRCDGKLVKVLCNEMWTIQAPGGTSSVQTFQLDCPVNAPFEYKTGQQYGTAANLYLLVIPYASGGTSGTTLCGNFSWNFAVTFEDA